MLVHNNHISLSVCMCVCAEAELWVAQQESTPQLRVDDPDNLALPLWISPKAPTQWTKYPLDSCLAKSSTAKTA